MSNVPHTPVFKETSLPKHDYLTRVIGYSVATITILQGYWLDYFDSSVLSIALISLLYPHVLYVLTRPFRKQHPRATRHFLIHLDALLCGVFLGYMHLPLELTVLYLIMINTSFIIVGSISAWIFCVISLVVGASVSMFLFSHEQIGPVPAPLFITVAALIGLQLAFMAYNSNRQARDLKYLKKKFEGQVERFQALSYQVSKYVAPQIWESIFTGRRQVKLETQRKKLVIFFSDIVGFSALSDQIEAEALTDFLNQYLTEMSRIALRYGGTIDKFLGDGVMIFFGDPLSKGTKRDALACVSMAIEMRRHMVKLNQQWQELGMNSLLQVRMGINTGYCTVGNFGTESRMDYTIVGKEVNLASRLESTADPGEILISHETYSLIKDKILCRERGVTNVRGFREPVALYQVIDHRRQFGADPSFINKQGDGFSLYLDTDNIRNDEKEQLAEALEKAAETLRDSKGQSVPSDTKDLLP